MESMFCLVLSLEKAVIRTIMQFARYMPDITLSSAIPRVHIDFDFYTMYEFSVLRIVPA